MNVIATTITEKIDERKTKYVYPYIKRQSNDVWVLNCKQKVLRLKESHVHNGKQ